MQAREKRRGGVRAIWPLRGGWSWRTSPRRHLWAETRRVVWAWALQTAGKGVPDHGTRTELGGLRTVRDQNAWTLA